MKSIIASVVIGLCLIISSYIVAVHISSPKETHSIDELVLNSGESLNVQHGSYVRFYDDYIVLHRFEQPTRVIPLAQIKYISITSDIRQFEPARQLL